MLDDDGQLCDSCIRIAVMFFSIKWVNARQLYSKRRSVVETASSTNTATNIQNRTASTFKVSK